MTTVITLPIPGAAGELAAASGAPRPLMVQRVHSPGAATAVAPPLKFRPRPTVPEISAPGTESPPAASADPAGGHWHSDPEDDARVNAIARSVTQATLEVLGGTRPLQQLARWLDPPSYERLQLRTNIIRGKEQAAAARAGKAPAPPVLLHRRVLIRCCRVCPVSEGVYEAAVVAAEQDRVRAAALRIELRRGLWKVTALEIG